jgi:glycogen(starch) synthase
MRIVFITPEFVTEDSYSGGLANYVFRVSKSLVNMGHKVHVIVQTQKKEEIICYHGVWVHRINVGVRKPWIKKIIRNFFYKLNSMLLFSFRAWREVNEINTNKPIDIVQVSNLRACGLFSVFFFKNAPIVTRMSSYVKTLNEALNSKKSSYTSFIEFVEICQIKSSKYIYSPSQLIADVLNEKEGIKDVRVIRSPVYLEYEKLDDSLYYEQLKEKKYLLFVGSYRIHKGIHILGQALPSVFSSIPECEVVFIGKEVPTKDFPSMQAYIKEICKCHLNKLHFFDQMRHDVLYPIMENAHLVVLPSLIDNFPNALLESMMLGKVVVGTKNTSFDEVIEDGKNGFLVNPGNPKELADKIITAWRHPSLFEIALKSKETSMQFAPINTTNNLLKYYNNVIVDFNVEKKKL